MTTPELYTYSALIVEILDGDTVRANFDLGMYVSVVSQKVRLEGVWAPEKKQEHGEHMTKYLRSLIYAERVIIRTRKDKQQEKWGRWLGQIYLLDGANVNELVNEEIKRCTT